MTIEYIPLAECQHGGLYSVLSQHFTLAVYNEEDQTFVGIRHKLGKHYLFKIHHIDYDEMLGGVCPIALLEKCPLHDLSTDHSRGTRYVENHALMVYLQDARMQYSHLFAGSE